MGGPLRRRQILASLLAITCINIFTRPKTTVSDPLPSDTVSQAAVCGQSVVTECAANVELPYPPVSGSCPALHKTSHRYKTVRHGDDNAGNGVRDITRSPPPFLRRKLDRRSHNRPVSPDPRTPLVSPLSLASPAIPTTPRPRSPSRGPGTPAAVVSPRSIISPAITRSRSISVSRRFGWRTELDKVVAPNSPLIREGDGYNRRREAYVKRIYDEVNERVFESRLPRELDIVWNSRFQTTAGLTKFEKVLASGQVNQRVRIELSNNLLDHVDRLKSTLVHELCHAAAFLLSNATSRREPPHGPSFKNWANAARARYPELKIETCHSYDRGQTRQRRTSGFSKFVKENFGAFKAKCAVDASRSEVLRALSKEWARTRYGPAVAQGAQGEAAREARATLNRLDRALASPKARKMAEDDWIDQMMGALKLVPGRPRETSKSAVVR